MAVVFALPGFAAEQKETPIAAAATLAAANGAAMAATVRSAWPAGVIPTQARPGGWAYEVGTLLDGMTAQAKAQKDERDFAYVRATVDRWVAADGTISIDTGRPFNSEQHTLDNLEPGRAIVECYRQTHEERYAKAAKFLFGQFRTQPRTAEGGFWHKQIYPNQMWLDGAYMGEPFRAAYASTFGVAAEFDDIAKQLLLMDEHMRDPKTGLLRHGWDASRQEAWADKSTGLSQEVWARALGWYAMALVDTIPWFPANHPDRAKLIAVLQHVAVGVARYQDPKTGLWWDVLDKGGQPGNFQEASASAMFTYALARGVRLGYLPAHYQRNAARGWMGIQEKFITRDAAGHLTLHGTVKVSGLGGKPYRAGDYSYYVHEAVGDNDSKGVGAYLLAASEVQQMGTR
jgi:unsaturated rhamnogalacturonyl hydrolase